MLVALLLSEQLESAWALSQSLRQFGVETELL